MSLEAARERIRQAKETNASELSLSWDSWLKLSELPSELWELTNLTELDLRENDLTTLPPEIGKLTKLTELHLTDNRLRTLPPEIGKLTNLTEFTIDGNPLEKPPLEVAKKGIDAIGNYFRQKDAE